jgi:hypothetical protein
MSGCCPSSGGNVIIQAKNALDGLGGNGNMNTQIDPNIKVRMEYFGPRIGAVSYHGKRRIYRFGNNAIDRYDEVNPEDVETLLGQPNFRVIGKYAQERQPPGAAFIPEPAGEVVPEVAPPAEELEEIEIPIPEPIGKTTTLADSSVWEDEFLAGENLPVPDGEPPVLEIQPLPGTVKEIKVAVIGADPDTLLSWLREEQENKGRKTALEVIEKALEEKFS